MEQKLEAIKRLDKGETLQKVADDFGVGQATVGDWKKKRLEIEKCEALYVWFIQFRDKGVPILQQKALHFRNEFNYGGPDFTASASWLDRWKKRYGIRQLSVCGEKL
ncbi:hypothetical protein PR048_017413 [Dryococelus australis]|uniref:HTH CENPB-type domain-containing protein n=1 Tax=Dryococelus australis TaxID=614101 RepID=A0ABQ9H9I2_9NEOP|nr:hypothetical protein PR048_017413 [Dryococelus australis]